MLRAIERLGGDHIYIVLPKVIRRPQDEQLVAERLAGGEVPAKARRGTIFSLRQVRGMAREVRP
ncbi:MAG TPA: hypothetical protein VKP65_26090 [Rhodothermales bacterium]|nr:hypothetical protein [Rhodothermales bacterium]